jgi:hypothetical protein
LRRTGVRLIPRASQAASRAFYETVPKWFARNFPVWLHIRKRYRYFASDFAIAAYIKYAACHGLCKPYLGHFMKPSKRGPIARSVQCLIASLEFGVKPVPAAMAICAGLV